MLDRLYLLFKKKPRRVELDWYEIDPSAMEQGLVRCFTLPRRRTRLPYDRPKTRKSRNQASR